MVPFSNNWRALPRISLVLFHGSFAEESLVLQSVLWLTYKLCPAAISNGSYHPNGRNHMEQCLSFSEANRG